VVIASDDDRVIAMSRTYNQSQSGATGTFGQSLRAVPTDELIGSGDSRRIIFMSEDSTTRANLGCVNGTDSPVEITIDLHDSDGTSLATETMNLGAWGNNQINRIFSGHEPIDGYVELRSDTRARPTTATAQSWTTARPIRPRSRRRRRPRARATSSGGGLCIGCRRIVL